MLRQLARQLIRSVDATLAPKRSVSCTNQLFTKNESPAAVGPPPKEADGAVLLSKDDNVTLIGINRPSFRNAINSETALLLCEAFNQFEADETSPVAVLYGVGGSFCSGYDIFDLAKEGGQVSIELLMMAEGSVGPTRRHIKKPVVCGINGYCIANGLELALMCDLRVMEESAVLGFFNRRFGVPVIDGGTARLPSMIGFSRALDLILTGRPVDSKEAYNIGIANRIVPTGEAFESSVDLAKCLAKFPQSALNHDRNSLYSSVFEASTFNQAVQNEIMYTSKDIMDEMQEGIKWFNKTFKADNTHQWLKCEKTMADWDDEEVAAAAAKLEEKKKAEQIARIEADQKKKDDEQTTKDEKKRQKEEKRAKRVEEVARHEEQKLGEHIETGAPKDPHETQVEAPQKPKQPDDKNKN